MQTPEIPIFFTIDDGYAPFLAVALTSAISNSSPKRRYRAIVLHEGLSKHNAERLSAMAADNFAVELVKMDDAVKAIPDREGNRLRCDYFTPTIYFRLFIAELYPQLDRAIYIDSDVVVDGDLAELYDTDIGDCLIGACTDSSVQNVPELVYYMENSVGVERTEYINSGVLLMNLKALREEGFREHFLSLLSSYGFETIAPDQDYLNAICKGRIHYLDGRFDAMPRTDAPELESPCIIHYNLFFKPWCYDGVQYADRFWHYAELSGYGQWLRDYKSAYDERKKQADADCLKLLIGNAAEIPNRAVTFKQVADKGVRVAL